MAGQAYYKKRQKKLPEEAYQKKKSLDNHEKNQKR